jgi:hypothetical protein
MKLNLSITILLVVFCIGFIEKTLFSNNQNSAIKRISQKQSTIDLNRLTIKDKQNYELTVSLGKIAKNRCNGLGTLNPKTKIYKINVLLQNRSKDTLKYIDWTCSSEIWNIDNNKVNVYTPFMLENCGACDSNFITIFEVPPHKSKELYVYAGKKEGNLIKPAIKIGMILQRVIKKKDFGFYFDNFFGTKYNLSDQKMNLIWSNSIEMP